MRQSKWKYLHERGLDKAADLRAAEARLDAAIDVARLRYGGLLGRRYQVLDDPKVRAAMRHRDHILRDLKKISYARGGDRR